LLSKREPRAPEPGSVKRLDLRNAAGRGWAGHPEKGRGMEEERRRRGKSHSGSGVEGRSSGASCSKNKRRKSKGKEDNVKSEQKRNESNEEGLIPLNSWAQLLMERGGDPRGSGGSEGQAVVWRAETFRLLPRPEQEELLWQVGDAAARLINMENYRRRRLFFEGKGIDKSWKSAWKRRETEYAEIRELIGSINFHETCRAIGEQWRSFTELLKAKKRGRLEP